MTAEAQIMEDVHRWANAGSRDRVLARIPSYLGCPTTA